MLWESKNQVQKLGRKLTSRYHLGPWWDRHVNVSPGQESFVFARLNRKTPSLEETYPEGEKCTYGLTNQEAYVGGDKLQSIPTGGDVD
jgi:hypothetical protein